MKNCFRHVIWLQLMDTISNCVFCFRALWVMFSNNSAVLSSIHSSPHCIQICAGTLRTTTTPVFKSAVKVVLPFWIEPPQTGHCAGICFILFLFCFKIRFKIKRQFHLNIRFLIRLHKQYLDGKRLFFCFKNAVKSVFQSENASLSRCGKRRKSRRHQS